MAGGNTDTQDEFMPKAMKMVAATATIGIPASMLLHRLISVDSLPMMPYAMDRVVFTLQCHTLTAVIIMHAMSVSFRFYRF